MFVAKWVLSFVPMALAISLVTRDNSLRGVLLLGLVLFTVLAIRRGDR